MNINKEMYFCYLEGITVAKVLIYGEKLPRWRYKKTSFRAYIKKYVPELISPTEEEMKIWLDEYLERK